MYDSSVPKEKEFNAYLQKRPTILGWPSPEGYGIKETDIIGSRINTNFPNPSMKACISAYGNSFTWSAEVNPSDAWPNQLSELINCRVNNFGVGGYGTDQSFLRFYENKFDKPEILILGHFSENIMRNVNQFRSFQDGGKFNFKPRFIVDENTNKLKLVPILDFSDISYEDVYKNPKKYLNYDYFLPDGDSRLPYLRFPYFLTILKAAFSKKLGAFFDKNHVYFEDFYEPSHTSGALQVTEKIIEAFRNEAIRRGSKSVILVIPTAQEVMKFETTGKWSYQNLLSYLNDLNFDYINIGEKINSYLQKSDKEICDLYHKYWYVKGGCKGHFNKKGYKLVADSVYEKIRSLNNLEVHHKK